LTDSITFSVDGLPAPQGSKKRTRYGAMIESSKYVKPWRKDVETKAKSLIPEGWNMAVPMALSVVFRFSRPASHHSKSGLKSTAPEQCTSARHGDLDKLLRSTNDALSGVLFDDDRQVISIIATKRYCAPDEPQGAIITLTALTPSQ
jgi:crossover junction endodeoxyribonuclease RusA